VHTSRLLFALFSSACALANAAGAEGAESWDDLLRPAQKMTCSPREVSDDTILTITLPYPHGDYLIALQPREQGSIHIIYPWTDEPLHVSANEFVRLKTLTFKISAIRGSRGKGLQKVFVTAGRYTLIVGEGIETESPLLQGWCRVTYLP